MYEYLFKERKGYSTLVYSLIACGILGGLSFSVSRMHQVYTNYSKSILETSQAQIIAMNIASEMRKFTYDEVENVPLISIDGTDLYKEITVSDCERDASNDFGVEGKNVCIKIYKGNTQEKQLKVQLNIFIINPASMSDSVGLITNNSSNDSNFKVLSAEAFIKLVDSKVVNNIDSNSLEEALSASATRIFTSNCLKDYVTVEEAVKFNSKFSVGSMAQGVFVNSDGLIEAGKVIFRGQDNISDNALIISPNLGSNGNVYFDTITKKELFNQFLTSKDRDYECSVGNPDYVTINVVIQDCRTGNLVQLTNNQSINISSGSIVRSVSYVALDGVTIKSYTGPGVGHLVFSKCAWSAEPEVSYKYLIIPESKHYVYQLKLKKGLIGVLPDYNSSAISSGQKILVPYGTSFDITYTPNTGYYLNKLRDNGVVTVTDLTLTAPDANVIYTSLNVPKSNNYSYILTLNNSDFTLPSYVSVSTKNEQIINVPYNTVYDIKYFPDVGYELDRQSDNGKVLSKSVSITAPIATKKVFTVTIKQSANQTIKVVADGKTYTSSFMVPYGTSWTASVSPNTGYNAGSLNSTSGVITSDITVSASEASVKYYVVTLQPYSIQQGICFRYGSKVAYANGRGATTVSVPYGTSWTATACKNSSGYNWDNYGQISPTSGVITGNVTIKGISSPYDYSSGGGGSYGCGGEGAQ